MPNNQLRIAVLYRPGRNVEWQRKFTGQDIPDDAVEEATLHRDGIREAGFQAELVEWQGGDLPRMLEQLSGGHSRSAFNASSMQEAALLEAGGFPSAAPGLTSWHWTAPPARSSGLTTGCPLAPFVVIDKD